MKFLAEAVRAPVLFALLSLIATSVQADIVTDKMHRYTLTSPTGWTRVEPPSKLVRFAIRSPDKTTSIAVLVAPVDDGDDEAFVERFKKKWFASGTGNGKSEKIALLGRTAYRLRDTAILNGQKTHRTHTLLFNNGNFFQINTMSHGSDPLNDPAVEKCVASFRFLDEAPSNQRKPAQTTSRKNSKSQRYSAENLPELIADITTFVLIGIAAIYFIAWVLKTKR